MSYTPTNWQTGDIVTSEKLNKIEQELANPSSGNVVAHIVPLEGATNSNKFRTDITAQDLYSALNAGKTVVFMSEINNIISDEVTTSLCFFPSFCLDEDCYLNIRGCRSSFKADNLSDCFSNDEI